MAAGIGADIEEISRFQEKIADDHFLRLVFTQREIEYCSSKQDPAASFAGKFCAKEAVIKAWPHPLGMKNIEIVNEDSGKLSVYISGVKNLSIQCSISHAGAYALAVAFVSDVALNNSVNTLSYAVDKPLAYLTVLVLVDGLHRFLKRFAEQKRIGVSVADVVSWVVSTTLKRYPELNSRFVDNTIVYPAINLGYFLNLGAGVKLGVIKNADSLSLSSFSKEIKNLALRYVRGQLEHESWQESTFSVTNLGFSGLHSLHSPVIEHQSIMVALGSEFETVEMKESVVMLVHKFNLTLSFDARVADCQRAVNFLKEVQQRLEHLEFEENVD